MKTKTTKAQRAILRKTGSVDIQNLCDDVDDLEHEVDRNICDVCAGTGKPISDKSCICGGTGRMSDAAIHLRELLYDAEKKLEKAGIE